MILLKIQPSGRHVSPSMQLIGYLGPRFAIQKLNELKLRCKTTFEKPLAFETNLRVFYTSKWSNSIQISKSAKSPVPSALLYS